MTKKDYELIAAVIGRHVAFLRKEKAAAQDDGNSLGAYAIAPILIELRTLTSDLALAFAQENPRFKADVFVSACGF